jgi:anti-anti-sigma factor
MAPPPAFRIERLEAPEGVILLALAGEIDLATSGQFRSVVDEALAAGVSLVADVAEVTFMDSTMLRELLRAHRDLGGAGNRFILAAPQPPVRRLLELTGTHGLFTVSETREDAVASA